MIATDALSAYCAYAVLNMNYKPSEFNDLSQKEKAFVIAAIDRKLENEKKQADKAKAKGRRR